MFGKRAYSSFVEGGGRQVVRQSGRREKREQKKREEKDT